MSEASRWSCASSLGGTCSISYDLGATRNLSDLSDLRLDLQPLKQNITCEDTQAYECDGNAMVVRNSKVINIDAGSFDE